MKIPGLLLVLLVPSITLAAEASIRVALLGDSTVCAYPATRPERGWGMFVEEPFPPGTVKILNFAQSGRSTKTFIKDGLWDKVRA